MLPCASCRPLAKASENFMLHGLANPDLEELVDQVLAQTGRQNQRSCPLPARLIVWMVVMMSLYRNASIANVFTRLVTFLRETSPELRTKPVTPEAVYHARRRLGALPMKRLYRKAVKRQPEVKATFKGFRIFGVDGSEFTVPDTPENVAVFGRHTSDRGSAAYPQVRGLFLVDVAGHRITDCCFMPLRTSESAGLPFVIRSLRPGDLLLTDRGLTSFALINSCKRRDIRFLLRLSSVWKPRFYKRLGLGDSLMVFKPCGVAKSKLPPEERENEFVLRVLEFTVGKGQLVRLVTDLVDPVKCPALELAELYHRRWECELAYKELKSQLVAVTASKQQTHFRSKTAIGVLQEAWGMVLAHLFVRNLMLEGAVAAKISPLELSMTDSLEVIKASLRRFQAVTTPKARSRIRRQLIQDLMECRIDRPRRKRQCPRVVKRKMSNFKLKRENDRSSPLDLEVNFIDREVA